MKPFNLPKESFFARKEILLPSIEQTLSNSAKYIHQSYPHLDRLLLAEKFCKYDLMDAPTATVTNLEKVGFFPWVEASKELDSALSLLVMGSYKNTYDSLRRSIELIITGILYTLDHDNLNKARKWMDSIEGTPNFKRAVKKITNDNSFQHFDKITCWENEIVELYWKLCDIIHVKGTSNSFNDIAPKFFYISGVGASSFHEASCCLALDTYVKTVELIALTTSISNPVLLIGFDLDRKFGLNPPASGFFYPAQAERLTNLIPVNFQSSIRDLKLNNQGIKHIKEWFNSLPDLSEEEINQQAKQMGFD